MIAVANEDGSATGFASALAVNRADLRLAIVKFAARLVLQGGASDGERTSLNGQGIEQTAKRMRGTDREKDDMRAVAGHQDISTQRLCSHTDDVPVPK